VSAESRYRFFQPGWRILAIDCGHRADERVIEKLAERGVMARQIIATEYRRPNRRKRTKVPFQIPVPGYIFADCPEPDHRETIVDLIKERKDIYNILRRDNQDFVINSVQLEQICDNMIFDEKTLDLIGETVRFDDGPFTGHSGEVESQEQKGDKLILHVLLELMGGFNTVPVYSEQVSKVA